MSTPFLKKLCQSYRGPTIIEKTPQ